MAFYLPLSRYFPVPLAHFSGAFPVLLSALQFRELSSALLRISESAAHVRGLQNFDEACSSILQLCLRSIKVCAGVHNMEHPQSFWLSVAAHSHS